MKYLYNPQQTIYDRMNECAKNIDAFDPLLDELENLYPLTLNWVYEKVVLYKGIVKKLITLLLIGPKSCGKSSVIEILIEFINEYNVKL